MVHCPGKHHLHHGVFRKGFYGIGVSNKGAAVVIFHYFTVVAPLFHRVFCITANSGNGSECYGHLSRDRGGLTLRQLKASGISGG